jgi:hypothetical protein
MMGTPYENITYLTEWQNFWTRSGTRFYQIVCTKQHFRYFDFCKDVRDCVKVGFFVFLWNKLSNSWRHLKNSIFQHVSFIKMLEGSCFSPVHTDIRGRETILVVPRAETCMFWHTKSQSISFNSTFSSTFQYLHIYHFEAFSKFRNKNNVLHKT